MNIDKIANYKYPGLSSRDGCFDFFRREGFIQGAEWMRNELKQKTMDWLKNQLGQYVWIDNDQDCVSIDENLWTELENADIWKL